VSITLDLQIEAVKREIGMRKRVYPNWVANRKLTQVKADYEIAAMAAVLETLETLKKQQEKNDAQSVAA
jgi:hypothetical protein